MPKFDKDLKGPATDEAGVRQVYRALTKAGYLIRVQDGAGEVFPVQNEAGSIEEVMSCDDGSFLVYAPTDPNNRFGWVYFVYGNDPSEVVCDYTMNLEDVVGTLTESWWK